MPTYTPKYEYVEKKAPKYVNMNIVTMKELMHNIDVDWE
jgi:hypothetical protein